MLVRERLVMLLLPNKEGELLGTWSISSFPPPPPAFSFLMGMNEWDWACECVGERWGWVGEGEEEEEREGEDEGEVIGMIAIASLEFPSPEECTKLLRKLLLVLFILLLWLKLV